MTNPRTDERELNPATLTARVRARAADLGVSERTIWRHVATAKAVGPERVDLPKRYEECRYCREPLPENATLRRQYCDDRCRVGAARRRRNLASFRDASRHRSR